jgi:hypothetical protein
MTNNTGNNNTTNNTGNNNTTNNTGNNNMTNTTGNNSNSGNSSTNTSLPVHEIYLSLVSRVINPTDSIQVTVQTNNMIAPNVPYLFLVKRKDHIVCTQFVTFNSSTFSTSG